MVLLRKFKTLIDLLDYFKDEQTCREYLEQIRWNGSLACPYKDCDSTHIHKFSNGITYKCAKCRRKYSVKVGTIFEDSKISLKKWYAAIYLITSHKKGISSLQLHRDLGVTQKTAWYMLHRVRHTLQLNTGKGKLTGTIQADETFMGGLEKNKHVSKRTENNQGRSMKTRKPVVGVIEKGGELRAKVVEDTSSEQLHRFVVKNVTYGSKLHTDEWLGYKGLHEFFVHNFVKHNEGEYTSNGVTTNDLEGFWSLLKRGVHGIYHSISQKHLQQYVDEFVFRYNSRTDSEDGRFDRMLNNIDTTLSYKQLINGRYNNSMEAQQGSLSL